MRDQKRHLNYAFKHGLSKTQFYSKWISINNRCYRTDHQKYPHYGGRGIKVLWPDFESFRQDMYEEYAFHALMFGKKNTTIDRINVNGHYEKSNCRFRTNIQQQNNKTDSHWLTYKGETRTVTEWARKIGKHDTILFKRIRKGYSPEQIINGVGRGIKGFNKTGSYVCQAIKV